MCSNCRGTLELLKENGIDPDIIEYLSENPTYETLKSLHQKLGVPVSEMVRTKEKDFDPTKVDLESTESVLQFLAKNTKFLQRPIVVRDDRAVIARPPEKLSKLL